MGLPLLGAAVSGVLGLIGAKKAAKEQANSIAEQNAYNDPSAIRARAEAAGFNPLLFVGPGVGNQTSIASPVMGQAIANAGLAIAGGLSDYSKERAAQSALAQENAELRKVIDQSILRPEVPGIYGTSQPVVLPAARKADVLGPVFEVVPDNVNPNGMTPVAGDKMGRVPVPETAFLDRAPPAYFMGFEWQSTPGFSPGQVWEDKYGDTPLNWPIAAANLAADFGYNAARGMTYAKHALRRAGARARHADQLFPFTVQKQLADTKWFENQFPKGSGSFPVPD